MSQKPMQQVKTLIKNSYYASEKAHDLVFEEYKNKDNEVIASSFINKAISLISSAKAIYFSSNELTEKAEIENIFNKFDIFESEFLSNFATDHSHQWTDIEFNAFKESVNSLFDV